MKILQITPQSPGYSSGGQIGICQTLLSVVGNGHEIDYIGPEIEVQEIRDLYTNKYILEESNNLFLRIYDTLHMNTNKRYRSWLKLNLDFKIYDVIILDFTKLDYVLDKIDNTRLIVRVHNVEKDYSDKNYLHHKTLINYLDKSFAKKREKRIVERAQKLLVLTEKDKKRLTELYHVPECKMSVVPVCVRGKDMEVKLASKDKTVKMILTGSLWFGPNYEGVKWFLNNVYCKLDFPKELVIAGANPNTELVELAKRLSDIVLVDTPVSMEPYFKMADIAIAPVFDGAGMKVKVAEALSYGLPVIGTSHAFEGYHIIHGENSYLCNQAEEFIQCIQQFYMLDPEKRMEIKKNCYLLYQQLYSQDVSERMYQLALESI